MLIGEPSMTARGIRAETLTEKKIAAEASAAGELRRDRLHRTL